MKFRLLIASLVLSHVMSQPLLANPTADLFQGIEENNLAKVVQALDAGADINYQRAKDLATPIMVSVHKFCNDLRSERGFTRKELLTLAIAIGVLAGGNYVIKKFVNKNELIKKFGPLGLALSAAGCIGYTIFTAPRQPSYFSFEIFEKCVKHAPVNLTLTNKEQKTVLQILESYRSAFTTWDRYLFNDMKKLLKQAGEKK